MTSYFLGFVHEITFLFSDLGSVWIQLKTEKHCSKIIFKCVNSTVGPIFNKKVADE